MASSAPVGPGRIPGQHGIGQPSSGDGRKASHSGCWRGPKRARPIRRLKPANSAHASRHTRRNAVVFLGTCISPYGRAAPRSLSPRLVVRIERKSAKNIILLQAIAPAHLDRRVPKIGGECRTAQMYPEFQPLRLVNRNIVLIGKDPEDVWLAQPEYEIAQRNAGIQNDAIDDAVGTHGQNTTSARVNVMRLNARPCPANGVDAREKARFVGPWMRA